MSSVNFDPSVGGDGSTVSDDTDPTTGLANGGHRTRFVPALAQIVAIALWVKNRALEVLAYRDTASTAATTATTGASTATTQAGIATTKAGEASTSAAAAAGAVATHAGGTNVHAIASVSGLQAALDAKAPLASPALTGNPTAPTQATSDNSTRIATTALVTAKIAAMVDAAPGTLDTLNELAAALADDPNFATTMTTALAGKAATEHDHGWTSVWTGSSTSVNVAALPDGLYMITNSDGVQNLCVKRGSGGLTPGMMFLTAANTIRRHYTWYTGTHFEWIQEDFNIATGASSGSTGKTLVSIHQLK